LKKNQYGERHGEPRCNCGNLRKKKDGFRKPAKKKGKGGDANVRKIMLKAKKSQQKKGVVGTGYSTGSEKKQRR